jgi:hypothetical protein
MSQFSQSNYDVQKTSGICAATGEDLAPGSPCYSALVDIPAEEREQNDQLGMRRVDVSAGAWDDGFRPPHLFSFWKTTIPEPNQKKKTFVDDAVLLNLLRRLEDAVEPQRLAFRYVVALILMRKKLLRFDGSERRPLPPEMAAAARSEVDGETPGDDPGENPGVAQTSGAEQNASAEGEFWLFTPKKDVSKGHFGKWSEDESLEVLDPRLDESQIEQVTSQLGEILEAEL